MLVLDTNVVSEAMKPRPDPGVQAWLDRQAATTLFLTSVTVAELLFGVGALPEGRRQRGLAQAVEGLLGLFEGRILAFDEAAARCHAGLALQARQAGLGMPTPDGYIAAIAAARGFAVASRDTAPYAAAGLAVIDPWQA